MRFLSGERVLMFLEDERWTKDEREMVRLKVFDLSSVCDKELPTTVAKLRDDLFDTFTWKAVGDFTAEIHAAQFRYVQQWIARHAPDVSCQTAETGDITFRLREEKS